VGSPWAANIGAPVAGQVVTGVASGNRVETVRKFHIFPAGFAVASCSTSFTQGFQLGRPSIFPLHKPHDFVIAGAQFEPFFVKETANQK